MNISRTGTGLKLATESNCRREKNKMLNKKDKDHVAHLCTMNVCDTKREATNIAEGWNQHFKEQGRYFLDYVD